VSGKTVRILVHVEPPRQGGYREETLEFDESELAGKSPAEREAYLSDAAAGWVNEICPWGFEELPGEGEEA
jgi:hypothetical protein